MNSPRVRQTSETCAQATGVVLVGQGRWSRDLARGLAEYAGMHVRVVALDGIRDAVNLAGWLAIARAKLVVAVGFRPGASTVRGRFFDAAFTLALRLGGAKRVVHYWIGSEVQRALADAAAHGVSPRQQRRIARARHLAGSDILARDLASIGIEAEVVEFPWLGMPADAGPAPMPPAFSVLTYIPDARPGFYGGPQIVEAAKALPAVSFTVVGGTGAWLSDAPPNVRFVGWQSDMSAWYRAAACIVRLVEYDSVGGTVVEGLAYGRTVIYSHELPHTRYVAFGDTPALIDLLSELSREYRGASTPPDTEAAAWALREYDAATMFKLLAERLEPAGCGLGAARVGDAVAPHHAEGRR